MPENVSIHAVRSGNGRHHGKLLLGLAGLSVLAAGAHRLFHTPHFVFTENAYVAVEIAQVASKIDGTIREIRVTDTQTVKKGDVLVVIDPANASLALAQAEAELGRAARRAKGYGRASPDAIRAGAKQARATWAVAGSREADVALISDAIVNTNPEVALARARRDQAVIDLEYTVIRAPVDGVVANPRVRPGQCAQAGIPLLAVVPLQDMYVDANFKKEQLENIRVGQLATLRADLYGDSVTYHGVVEGFSGGSDAVFSAIQAQNPTGNWIEVMQRLPVRIKLDPAELRVHPLKVGLLMTVKIDTN